MMDTLLLIAIVLLLLWMILVFEIHIPMWAMYLLGVIVLLLLFAWLISIFRNGRHFDGHGRAR